MVDNYNNPDNYKTLKISIGGIIKKPEMLKFLPDHLKTEKLCKNAVKKLPFVIFLIDIIIEKCVIKLF